MGHSVINCEDCGSMVMEGRNEWECDCGWKHPNKAKQKPVMQCECCCGSGVISEHIESLNDLEKCPCCNGKGYTLEEIK